MNISNELTKNMKEIFVTKSKELIKIKKELY